MARYNLARMWLRAANPKRREVTLRKVELPSTLAANLFQRYYAPVLHLWELAGKAALDAYAASLAELTRDSPANIGEALGQYEDQFLSMRTDLRNGVGDWAIRAEGQHRKRWRGAVLTATKVDVGTLIGAADMRMPISQAVERNVGLISNVSDQARLKIGEAVFAGLNNRTPVRDVAKQIQAIHEMSRRRAMNIASDQLVKLTSALNDERRREAGMSGWEWVHSGKVHFRQDHKARNGKRYDDSAKEGARKPPEDRPGQLPFCGCTSRAILDLDMDLDDEPYPIPEPVAPAPPPAPRPARPRARPPGPRPAPAPAIPELPAASPSGPAVLEGEGRSYVLDKGRSTGVEHVFGYDRLTGELAPTSAGTKNSCKLSEGLLAMMRRADREVIVHHNHPSSSSLSKPDLDIATAAEYPGAAGIWAHGHDGSEFFASRGERPFTKTAYDSALNATVSRLQELVNAGELTAKDANAVAQHMINTILDGYRVIIYRAKFSADQAALWGRILPKVQKMLESLRL